MIIGFFNGAASGFAIPIAQRFGAKDYPAMRRFFAGCLWLCAVLSAVVTALVCIFCRDILILMHTPEDIFARTYNYLFVIFLGIPITFLYNLLSGAIRALGDSRTPVIFLLISGALNVFLNILSICALHMDVEGPAWATVISSSFSVVLCLVHIIRKFDILHPHDAEWKPVPGYITALLKAGLPMGLQFSVTAIGSVILQTAVNLLGSTAVASMAAGDRIVNMFACVFNALGSTMATFAGQNMGACRIDRIKSGLKSAVVISLFYSLAAFVLLIFCGRPLLGLFIKAENTAVTDQAYLYLLCCTGSYVFLSLVNTVRPTIQGMGYSMFAMFAGIFELVARSFIGIALVPVFGFFAVCFSSPLAWAMADCFLVPAFFFCARRLERLFEKE